MWIEQLKRIMERNPHMKSDASYTALGYSKKGFGACITYLGGNYHYRIFSSKRPLTAIC
ncbi:hypothetical protein [Bacillus sp. TH13]|uniref:hypothetical protein n=1 Tax=Bacillus sp. TH13 TaxID=2796379 RepID=UPI001F5B12CD|nr:hypothetical protein [Bacillus sp. TH13]